MKSEVQKLLMMRKSINELQAAWKRLEKPCVVLTIGREDERRQLLMKTNFILNETKLALKNILLNFSP